MTHTESSLNTLPDSLGTRRLIAGDINTGKTTLCQRWLNDLCQRGLGERIAVIDMAPTILYALALKRGIVGAGGELRAPAGSNVLDLRALIEPPRLSSNSEEEAIEKARINAQTIDALIAQLPAERDILFINDVTLYLQASRAETLIQSARFEARTTLIANGYQGERLGGGTLTQHETTEMAALLHYFEQRGEIIRLTHRYEVNPRV